MPELSEYELQRLKSIKENEEMLIALGLANSVSSMRATSDPSKLTKKRQREAPSLDPSRVSDRLANKPRRCWADDDDEPDSAPRVGLQARPPLAYECLKCTRSYASTDAVRKHAREVHPEWLQSLGRGTPSLYCRRIEVSSQAVRTGRLEQMPRPPGWDALEQPIETPGSALQLQQQELGVHVTVVVGATGNHYQPVALRLALPTIGMLRPARPDSDG